MKIILLLLINSFLSAQLTDSFQLGEYYEAEGQWADALYWYLEAFQENPTVTDPIKKITQHYQKMGQNDLAYLFAKHGSLLEPYNFDEDLSIVSYYTPFKEDGYTAANNLLINRQVPGYIKSQTYRNILFYVENLPATYLPIEFDCPEPYHPMNPSIVKTDEGYTVICRTVNYTQTGAKYYYTPDPEGIFRTRNFLLTYDPDFQLLSQQEMVENLPRPHYPRYRLDGIDDCRLFEMDGSYWFTGNVLDSSPHNIQISLCKLSDLAQVQQVTPLLGPDPYRCEKNWLPFVVDGKLHTIYSYDPFILFQPNLETGECPILVHYTPEHDFSHFRGGAAPVVWDGGYLAVIHEVVQHPNSERTYLHRFIYLDANFQITRVSKPFTFIHNGIEFCGGLTLDHSGSQALLTVGIEDHDAYICMVDLETVREWLQPLQ